LLFACSSLFLAVAALTSAAMGLTEGDEGQHCEHRCPAPRNQGRHEPYSRRYASRCPRSSATGHVLGNPVPVKHPLVNPISVPVSVPPSERTTHRITEKRGPVVGSSSGMPLRDLSRSEIECQDGGAVFAGVHTGMGWRIRFATSVRLTWRLFEGIKEKVWYQLGYLRAWEHDASAALHREIGSSGRSVRQIQDPGKTGFRFGSPCDSGAASVG